MNTKLKFDLLTKASKSGNIFGATFVKNNKELRSGAFRGGVKIGVTGKGLNYKPSKVFNVIVYDMNKGGFRTIKAENLKQLRFKGITYNFLVKEYKIPLSKLTIKIKNK